MSDDLDHSSISVDLDISDSDVTESLDSETTGLKSNPCMFCQFFDRSEECIDGNCFDPNNGNSGILSTQDRDNFWRS